MIGIYLFDNKQNLIKSISPKNLTENKQEQELNGLISSQVTIKYDLEDEEIYNKSSYFGQKENDNFWLYKIRMKTKQNGLLTFVGVHILFDDLKNHIIRDKRPTEINASIAISQILNDTDWTVGFADTTGTNSARYYHKTVLSCFTDILEKWNCEFKPKITFSNGKISRKEIILHDKLSEDYGKWFEYGDKLIDVIAEENHDICTAFIGMGKGEEIENDNGDSTGGYGRKIKFTDISWSTSNGKPVNKPKGQDYVEIKEATELFGYPDGSPKIGIIDFQEIEDREELLQATYDYAIENCRPKLQLKSRAITEQVVELGEVCSIIRPDLNIRYKTRIFKITKDFLNPKLIEFEFGDKVILSSSDRVKENETNAQKKEEELSNILDQLVEEITNSYFNEDGYNYELKVGNKYNLPAGYYSFDRPIDKSPNKVIYTGAGKMMIANSKTSSGQWRWTTMGTGDGLVADAITAGTLNANLIKAGALVGKGFNLDLNSGSFNLADKIKYNPSTNSFTIDGNTVIRAINNGSIRIAGSSITLDGNVNMTNSFTVPSGNIGDLSADKITSGTINADNINVKNLNANNLTKGSVGVGLGNSSALLPSGSAGAEIHGGATDLNTNSKMFDFNYRSNSLEVQGRINAMPQGSNHAMELNGLSLNTPQNNCSIKPWNGYIRCEGNSWHFTEVKATTLYVGGKRLILKTDGSVGYE